MNKRTTSASLLALKQSAHKAVWLTAYDAISTQLAEAAGVDVILVGDSLGMVCLGYPSTVAVTLEQMIHHTQAVVRARSRAWVVCDLPFGTYQHSPEQAFENSVKVIQSTGCDAVKLEGGAIMVETVRFLSDRGIAVVGHLGLLPQSINQTGRYRQHGINPQEAEQLLTDAQALAEAGAAAIVLECIPALLANRITQAIDIPTVGIGAGDGCDAQVLVWHDLLGLSEKNPSFAPTYLPLRQSITDAIGQWAADVRQSRVRK
ncbi:MAG: 3-methyl-2-oxobutanoate hydroxymethyltransferase [Zetaproteobacteria bacterium]|nr:3-methyl-2-oxobutanoate hydroxymethyltransferase [Zetaproteobacteria bacterium]